MKYKFHFLVLVIVFLDQITKFLFKDFFVDLGIFSLDYTTNTGMVFGLFKGFNLLFIILSLIILVILFFYYNKHRKFYIGFSFVVGGLIGNLIDRIVFGHVRDFIDLNIWPVFNLADSFIVMGVILLLFKLRKS